MAGRAWTQEEIDTLFQMRVAGEKWVYIAAILGRTDLSCWSFYRDEKRRRNREPKEIPLTLPAWDMAIPDACALLARRVNAAIDSFANDNRITAEAAKGFLLGREPEKAMPGTERTIRGQAAERMLAA